SEPVLELTQLKGDFRFDSHTGLRGKGISARAFDRPVTAQIVAEGRAGALLTRAAAAGQVAVKNLPSWLTVPQPLPVSGVVPYQLPVLLAGADRRLSVSSPLKGVAIDLPAPFGMAASA
ncbi:hypothetical protein B1218_38650, partial [Pseudomonas ogarae]